MATKVYQISGSSNSLSLLNKRDMADLRLHEVSDLERWLASCGDQIFNRRILWIAREDWSSEDQRCDVLGISDEGDLIVVELKRGIASEAAIVQVLGYAAEYRSKTPEELAEIFFNHSQKIGATSLVTHKVQSREDARNLIDNHVAQEEINAAQILLILAEGFNDRALSIGDYINQPGGTPPFSLEFWQFGIHPLKTQSNVPGDHIFVVEQILPPPSIRAQIEADREVKKTLKWARDPHRIKFMQLLAEYLEQHQRPLKRAKGQSYAGNIEVAGINVTFQIQRNELHPWLDIPNTLTLELNADDRGMSKGEYEGEGGWYLEFTDVDANSLEFTPEFGQRLLRVLARLNLVGLGN